MSTSPQRVPASSLPSSGAVPAEREQSQSQNQSQVVTLNLQNSSDPRLEAEILGKLHSAGRQLGRISAVVELLVQASAEHAALRDPAAVEVLTAFRSMQDDIERAKRARRPEHYIAELERLRSEDPQAFAQLARELRDWLDGASA